MQSEWVLFYFIYSIVSYSAMNWTKMLKKNKKEVNFDRKKNWLDWCKGGEGTMSFNRFFFIPRSIQHGIDKLHSTPFTLSRWKSGTDRETKINLYSMSLSHFFFFYIFVSHQRALSSSMNSLFMAIFMTFQQFAFDSMSIIFLLCVFH